MQTIVEKLLDYKEFDDLKHEYSLVIDFDNSDDLVLRNVDFNQSNPLKRIIGLDFDFFNHEPEEEFELGIQLHINLKIDHNKEPQVVVDSHELLGLTIENKSKLTSKNYVQFYELSKYLSSEIEKRLNVYVN